MNLPVRPVPFAAMLRPRLSGPVPGRARMAHNRLSRIVTVSARGHRLVTVLTATRADQRLVVLVRDRRSEVVVGELRFFDRDPTGKPAVIVTSDRRYCSPGSPNEPGSGDSVLGCDAE